MAETFELSVLIDPTYSVSGISGYVALKQSFDTITAAHNRIEELRRDGLCADGVTIEAGRLGFLIWPVTLQVEQ
ncbi:hypothetical protein M0638_27940 [Roseomonas sp. NAR14]|uniref:Uncharacterized protein n=1 Tax=Roseomonas acroporae TaxID=2937791 RepID=A0A9X1YEF8_9PROT|nr:hypothetical protein [Roseomonas acroporae]MCK8788185.1 hypothetical protein [Roseomonas acroporae]